MSAEALTNSESLTTEEFQRQLCTWIEEKGLLNELRTHLRKKMIFMLQDTTIDKTTSSATRLSLTPKHQALSLLVAEFLLVAELHYSLSVFSSELSNISHVTKFCEKAQNAKTRGEANPKIQSSDVLDILESLGFSTTSKESQNISDLYNNAPDRRESLLCCIIKTMAIMSDMAASRNPVKHVESSTDFLPPLRSVQSMGDFMQILQDYNLIEYKDIVELFIEKEISRVRAEEKQKYKNKLYQHQKLLAHEIKLRESMVVSKLEQAEKRLFTQKQIIQSDLKKKQNRLQELADELNILHSQLTRREEDIQKQQEEFRSQEAHWKAKQTESNFQLGQRLQELNMKQIAIKSESKQLVREKEELSTEVAQLHEKKQELEEATKISRTNSEISFLHELRMQCKDLKNELEQTRTSFAKPSISNEEASTSLTVNDKSAKECKINNQIHKVVKETPVTNSDKIDIKELLLTLQKENSELRAQLSEHRASISDLRTQLTECQNIRDLFHSRVVHQLNVPITSAPIITMGAPIPVVNTESHTRQAYTLCGAGEDLNLLNNNRQRPPRGASRRSSEICTEHIPTDESDSAEASPTQSVIRDARERLRTLEGESEALERAFQHYKQRIDSRNMERAYLNAAHRDLVDIGVPRVNTISMSRKSSDYRLPNNHMIHSCKNYNNSECGYSVPVTSHYDLMYNDDSEERKTNNVQCISRKYSYDHEGKETVHEFSLNETSRETPSHDDIDLLDIDMNSASNCRIKGSTSIHESNNISNGTSESLINQNKTDLIRCSFNLLDTEKLETSRPSSSPLPSRNVYKSVYKKCSNTTILSHAKCPEGCKLFNKRSDTKMNDSLTSFSPPQRGIDVEIETNKLEFVENNINNASPLINRLPTSSTSCESKISNGKLTVDAVESRTDLSIQCEPSLENESSIENKNSTTMEESAPFPSSEETSEETSYNENSVLVHDKTDTILQLDTKKYKKGGYHKTISKKLHSRALTKKRTLLNPRLRSPPRLCENRDDLNSGYGLQKVIKQQIAVISNEAPESNICDNSRNISDKNLVPSLELSPINDSNENIHQNISSDAKLLRNDNNIDIMDISNIVLDLLPSDEVDELDDDPVFSIDKPSFSSPIEIGIPDCTCPLIQTPRAHVQFCSSNSALNYESPSDSPRFASNLCATLTDPLLPIYPKKVYSSTMPALTPVSEKTEISENISPKSEETQVSVGKMSLSSTNSW